MILIQRRRKLNVGHKSSIPQQRSSDRSSWHSTTEGRKEEGKEREEEGEGKGERGEEGKEGEREGSQESLEVVEFSTPLSVERESANQDLTCTWKEHNRKRGPGKEIC